MKNIYIILGLLAVAVLQTAFVSFFNIVGVAPNLVLVLALFLVIRQGFEEKWQWILLLGIFFDFFSGHPFGLVSLGLVGTAYLINLINTTVFSEVKFWIASFLVAIGTFIYNILLVILMKLSEFLVSYSFFGLNKQAGSVLQPNNVVVRAGLLTLLLGSLKYLLIEIFCNLLILILLFYVFEKFKEVFNKK